MDLRSYLNWKSALVLFAITVSLFVLLSLLVRTNVTHNACRLLTELPDETNFSNITSKELNVLVSFSGYMRLNTRHFAATYLPLELTEVSLEYENQVLTVHITTNCAKLEMPMKRDSGWKADTVQLEPTSSFSEELPLNELSLCQFDVYDVHVDDSMGYSCFKNKTSYCFKDDGHAIEMNVHALAMEINGDKDAYKRGSYSKPSNKCF